VRMTSSAWTMTTGDDGGSPLTCDERPCNSATQRPFTSGRVVT
jgi:hypothetical protein